jgi:hypothetical protein
MLLNNFKTLINNRITSSNNLSYTTMGNIVSNSSSSSVLYSTGTSNHSVDYTTPNTSNYLGGLQTPQLIVGTGATTPTLADYKLANYIYVPTTSGTQTNSNAHLTTVQTFQNIGSSSVTINEVGLIIRSDDNNNDYPQVLLTRSVLTTPVTIDAGASKTFTVDIDINKFVDNTSNS